MSQENVELVRRLIDAFNRGDWDALLEGLDPASSAMGRATSRGRVKRRCTGDTRTCATGSRSWRRFSPTCTPVPGDPGPWRSHRRDREDPHAGEVSGAATESRPVAYVIDYENGKATRIWSYMDPAEALAAAGLSE